MSYTYKNKARTEAPVRGETEHQPSLDALRSGAAAPTREQMGHRVDLPDAMREKMENAFGADLSAVKLYESETVADAGVDAVTQGSNIAFAPGLLDFTSFGGQELLGHEISHVVSQARGEVTGSGLLNDRALEARADREGAMAASGQQISVPSGAMSSVTAAEAAGPMQCRNKKESEQMIDDLHRIGSGMYAGANITPADRQFYNNNIGTLSKREMNMIGKRSRQDLRDQYSLYESLLSGPFRNSMSVQKQLSTSQSRANMQVYSNMVGDHATANNYTPAQRTAAFKGLRGALSWGDRRKSAELDKFVPADSTYRGDSEWQSLSDMRKGIMKSIYQRSRHH